MFVGTQYRERALSLQAQNLLAGIIQMAGSVVGAEFVSIRLSRWKPAEAGLILSNQIVANREHWENEK